MPIAETPTIIRFQCVLRFIWVVIVAQLCLSSVLDPRMQS